MSAGDGAAPVRAPPGLVAKPLPRTLLAKPLDYLHAEHRRLRLVCSLFQVASEARQIARGHAQAASWVLACALPLHRADEEQDLFPALLRYAWGDDDLAGAIGELQVDHRRMNPLQTAIVDALALSQDKGGHAVMALSWSVARLLRTFADVERRHVAVETGIVLAIARARIPRKGLAQIAATMRARRTP